MLRDLHHGRGLRPQSGLLPDEYEKFSQLWHSHCHKLVLFRKFRTDRYRPCSKFRFGMAITGKRWAIPDLYSRGPDVWQRWRRRSAVHQKLRLHQQYLRRRVRLESALHGV